MKTGKIIHLLDAMFEETKENGNKICSSAINMGVWRCQQMGYMNEYSFIPFKSGPFCKNINGALWFSAMIGFISVHNGDVKSNGLNKKKMIEDIKLKIPDNEKKAVKKIVKDMKVEGLLTNKEKISDYWKKEYDNIKWQTLP